MSGVALEAMLFLRALEFGALVFRSRVVGLGGRGVEPGELLVASR